MNAHEAAQLLTAVSAYDGRVITQQQAIAWSLTLAEVELADALEWLPHFYAQRPAFGRPEVWPHEVLEGVAQLHRERLWRAGREAYFAALEGVPHTMENRIRATEAGKRALERVEGRCRLALTSGSEK